MKIASSERFVFSYFEYDLHQTLFPWYYVKNIWYTFSNEPLISFRDVLLTKIDCTQTRPMHNQPPPVILSYLDLD